jgi:hypothetical protein
MASDGVVADQGGASQNKQEMMKEKVTMDWRNNEKEFKKKKKRASSGRYSR